MNRRALVATHHKTGTTWMIATFREISRRLDIPYLNAVSKPKAEIRKTTTPLILFHGHGFKGHSKLLADTEVRIFHLIRDPRDVVISGMRFHRVARETWLHNPKNKFDGLSYQAKLNSLPTDRERYLFEMKHVRSIGHMMNWDYGLPNCFTCKYEDLICDTDTEMFAKIASHLGFSDGEVDICRECFWRHHIFGGMSEEKLNRKRHVRAGDARQWPAIFDREMGEEFMRCHGEALVRLGYEVDDSWIGSLPSRCQ
ncbi:MAG TPA: sulfotransferase domain-containing protein [Rhizomicrobium sp.]|jgi:hypothetical protein|nr:sulfotransferase domain-containing protein [Rhizomicrobium sp.]